ncbi:hypothetical protein Dimus_038985 [Dionaea muscipula]
MSSLPPPSANLTTAFNHPPRPFTGPQREQAALAAADDSGCGRSSGGNHRCNNDNNSNDVGFLGGCTFGGWAQQRLGTISPSPSS